MWITIDSIPNIGLAPQIAADQNSDAALSSSAPADFDIQSGLVTSFKGVASIDQTSGAGGLTEPEHFSVTLAESVVPASETGPVLAMPANIRSVPTAIFEAEIASDYSDNIDVNDRLFSEEAHVVTRGYLADVKLDREEFFSATAGTAHNNLLNRDLLQPRSLVKDTFGAAITYETGDFFVANDNFFRPFNMDPRFYDEGSDVADTLVVSTEITSVQDYIFIDTNVENYQELAETWAGKGVLVLIDGSRDGVDQIMTSLAGVNNIGAIHLVSHGDEGVFWLGTTQVDSASVSGALSASLASIGAKLSVDGDILIYGCDVGSN